MHHWRAGMNHDGGAPSHTHTPPLPNRIVRVRALPCLRARLRPQGVVLAIERSPNGGESTGRIIVRGTSRLAVQKVLQLPSRPISIHPSITPSLHRSLPPFLPSPSSLALARSLARCLHLPLSIHPSIHPSIPSSLPSPSFLVLARSLAVFSCQSLFGPGRHPRGRAAAG